MDIKVTITKVLKDEQWGFSDLVGNRSLDSEIVKREILELILEDMYEVTNKADFKIQRG